MSQSFYPHSLETEQKVLGLMLKDVKLLSKGCTELTKEHFYDKKHALIFENIFALYQKGKNIDNIVLIDRLKANKVLDAIGGPAAIADLIESAISKGDFDTYLEILEDKRVKRVLVQEGHGIADQASNDVESSKDLLHQAFHNLWSRSSTKASGLEIISSGKIYERRKQEIISQQGNEPIRFGYPSLDRVVPGGFTKEQISIMAARPGVGKSGIKTNWIINQCRQGLGVVSFEPEQGFNVAQARMEAIIADIPLTEVLDSYRWKRGDKRIDKIKKANKEIDEQFNYHCIPSRSLSVSDVRTVLYQISQDNAIDIVYFDLFDRLMDVNVSQNKAQNVGRKLTELSQIAQEFNTHMCLLVQISREAEKNRDKRPKLHHLKDSGSYEEHARLIMLLYREGYYRPDEAINADIEVEIAKQSNGPPGDIIKLYFDEQTLRISDKEFGGLDI